MFLLLPWRKERKADGALARRDETPLGLMRREFAPLFDRFFGGWPVPFESLYEPEAYWGVADNDTTALAAKFESLYEPEAYWGLEMEDAATEFVIKAEMPGFEPAEIEVLVTGDILKIKAEHKAKVKGKGKEEEEVVERRVEREVTLPVGTDAEKFEARYHNGLLEVHLPKAPEVKPRRIEVKV